MEVKMAHDEDKQWSEIRFSITGEEREMDGVLWSLIFGAGQKPIARAESLLKHLQQLADKEAEAKAKAKEEAAAAKAREAAAKEAAAKETGAAE